MTATQELVAYIKPTLEDAVKRRAPFGLRYFATRFSPTIALFVIEIVLCLLSRKLIETLLHFIAGTEPWLDEEGKAQVNLLERMLKQPVTDYDPDVAEVVGGRAR